MKVRAFGFAVFMGGTMALLAVSNVNCSVLNALAGDGGGTPPASDGGGTAGGDDGGGAATNGSVVVTFNCAGDACGKSGTLVGKVKACGAGGAVVKEGTQAGVTMAQGTPAILTVADVPAGGHCLVAYLDVNNDNQQNTGDAVPAGDEVSITVAAGAPTAQTVDLASLKP